MMIPTDNEEAIEAETFEPKLARDIDGKSIKIFEEKAVTINPAHAHTEAWMRGVFVIFIGFIFSMLAAFWAHTQPAAICMLVATIICYLSALGIIGLSRPKRQTILVPTGRGQDLLIDVHGGLACDICGTPERSLYPPEPSLVARYQSAKLVEARYKAAKIRGHYARCNCVRCYNVNKWFTKQEFIAFYNREPAKDNIGYSYRK